jgi:hypothetical protein
MATVSDRLQRQIEAWYPHVWGAVAAALALHWTPRIATLQSASVVHLDEAYTALFGLATVFTGFLFTFYSFVSTAESGFLGKARSSIYMKRANRFTVTAIIAGSMLSIFCVPLLVFQPSVGTFPGNLAFAIWAGLSAWALLAFERAARLFILFVSRRTR